MVWQVLPEGPTAAATARRVARQALAAWCAPDEVVEACEIVVSELVANAVVHAGKAGGPVELRLQPLAGAVAVVVHDASPAPPMRRTARTWEEHGRGLDLVERLASGWGYRRTPEGKAVWADIACPGVRVPREEVAAPGE